MVGGSTVNAWKFTEVLPPLCPGFAYVRDNCGDERGGRVRLLKSTSKRAAPQ